MKGGSLNISLGNGKFSNKCHLFIISMFFKFDIVKVETV